MGKFFDDYMRAINQITEEVSWYVCERARWRVQTDFHKELLPRIGDATGHDNLALSCFVDVDMNSDTSLKVHRYNDHTMLAGMFKSHSSFHQRGNTWISVNENYGKSRSQFWAEFEGSGYRGDHGIVDTEWLADNFWDGVYYMTNGWPRSKHAEFLSVYTYREMGAGEFMRKYTQRYIRSNRYQKYIMAEIAALS